MQQPWGLILRYVTKKGAQASQRLQCTEKGVTPMMRHAELEGRTSCLSLYPVVCRTTFSKNQCGVAMDTA
eukprot:72271-Amphidinium_carterae.1